MSVTLTEGAISKIREIYTQDESLTGKALRIYIDTGGCSGYSYGFKFDDPKDADSKQDYESFKVIVDPQSEKLLNGATVDYRESFGQEGFAIQNPNAKKSCGCGNSFNA